MEVVLLGTGFPFPSPDRAGPSTLVKAGGLNLLFDCGRGVLLRLAGAGFNPVQMHTIFLTHLHSDHTSDFNDVFTTHWLSDRRNRPMRVMGPPGTEEFCTLTKQMLRRDIDWRIEYSPTILIEPQFEITEGTSGVVFDVDGVRVTADVVEHPPVEPCIGFRVEHEGSSVVIAGDTVPCEGLDRLCKDADMYVQTVFRPAVIGPLGTQMRYHSSTDDAARTAAKAGVKTLVYTHMMPAPLSGAEQEWINDAKPYFDGEVVLGEDLLTLTV
jgi:ribonuclease Z